jgi:hypothetical protein
MQRSKSTPAFASSSASTVLAKNASLFDINDHRGRLDQRALTAVPTPQTFSPPYTPRADRGDPFSLGGFFPSSSAETEWAWLRSEEEHMAVEGHDLFVLAEEDEDERPSAVVQKREQISLRESMLRNFTFGFSLSCTSLDRP